MKFWGHEAPAHTGRVAHAASAVDGRVELSLSRAAPVRAVQAVQVVQLHGLA